MLYVTRIVVSCLLLAFLSGGCLIVSVKGSKKKEVVMPEVVVYESAPCTADVDFCMEVDAIASLSMEQMRFSRYSELLRRDYLSAPQQIYLLESAMHHLRMDTFRLTIMQEMIDHPCFCLPAKRAILKHLQSLTMDTMRMTIFSKLEDKEPIPHTACE